MSPFFVLPIRFHPIIMRMINARLFCVKRNVTSNWHSPRENAKGEYRDVRRFSGLIRIVQD